MEEGVMGTCEKYDKDRDIWYEIADMNIPIKNASSCALTSDTIYLFGGTCLDGGMSDTIE